MKGKTSKILIFFLIILLSGCAPPPIVNQQGIKVKESTPLIKEITNGRFKKLESPGNNPTLQKQNSSLIINFYGDYQIDEQELIVVPVNFSEGMTISYTGFGWSISPDGINLDDISNSCEMINANTGEVSTEKICKYSFALADDKKWIDFRYNFSISSAEILKINYKFKREKVSKQILYITEFVSIPFLKGYSFCNYTYTIPEEGYKNLGLENNNLEKKSNNTYAYYGLCPSREINDTIRFAPEQSLWKADNELILEHNSNFTNNVEFFFPRYYRGGRLNNTFYKIYSKIKGSPLVYKEEDILKRNVEYQVEIPAIGEKIASVILETGFINNLNETFVVNIPESYYQINDSEIPQEIKDKAQEIVNNNPGVPEYYSIGKFVNSYMTYDLSYHGAELTAKEIFDIKTGVCEHYTILYNAMLNSRGIKTLNISGWAFQGNETSGNEKTVGHAWTVALIDGKWMELDSTWGLFEGIPAGHIFKNFMRDEYSWSYIEVDKPTFSKKRSIKLYDNISDISDISIDENIESQILTNTQTEALSNSPSEEVTIPNTNESTNNLSDEKTNIGSIEPNYTKSEELKTNTQTTSQINNFKSTELTNTQSGELIDNTKNIVIGKTTETLTNSITNNIKNISLPTTIPKQSATNIPSTVPKPMPTTIPVQNPGTANTIPAPPHNQNINQTDIILSFKQLQNFKQDKNDKTITYDFYAITTEPESEILNQIIIYVNLIKIDGTREDDITISNCVLNDLRENEFLNQAHFICSIKDKKEEYHSLRYNSSEAISGIPEDEYSLDPYMTQKYINENKINDAKKEEKLTSFIIKSINHDSCTETGKFTIIGDISQELSQPLIFTISLNEPSGIIATCNLTKNIIECKVDREINNNIIIIDQTIVKDNYKEVLFLSSAITQANVTCKNAIYEESVKKKEINISFRQVSHFTQNKNGFTFYLIALINKKYEKDYKLNINMNVFINKIKTEKNAICLLEKDVSPSNGGLQQGNFICTVNLNDEEYKNTNFTTISISPNNDEISGVSDLDEVNSNPYKTDEFIKDVKNQKSNGQKVNELTDITDYYSENKKIAPTLNIESIDINDCHNKGKIYIEGTLSDDINEKIKFDLPLTYPTAEIKCEIDKFSKNTKINIECKSQNKFEGFENVIIEPRLIKKKNQEILFIAGKEIKFGEKKECEDYNLIKTIITKKRQSQETKFTFLQLNKFQPKANGLNFFMALLRESLSSNFITTYTLTVKITIISPKRFLRNLDEEINQPLIPVSCALNDSLKTDLAAGYDCSNTGEISGTPSGMVLITDNISNISGIPDNINPAQLNNSIDYSIKANLEKVNNLPIVNITNINGDKCEENGQYNILAKLVDKNNQNLNNKYNNVEIRFSMPESSGLCEININDNIKMTCKNKEKFDVSQILIERQVIQDQNGNGLFIINSYTNPEVFGCDISYNSTPIKSGEPNESSKPEIPEEKNPINYSKRKNKGLTGGAIAGITIASVAVVGVVVTLIILIKRGVLLGKKSKFTFPESQNSFDTFGK